MTTTASVTCPLCEAMCGLAVSFDGTTVTGVHGDGADVFSRGFICPKGASIGALHHDPDRLRRPLLRRDGEFTEVTWDEAFAEIDRRLPALIAEHGRDAVAVYAGNPGAHILSVGLYGPPFYKALKTRNFYTAGTVDQVPKHFSAGTTTWRCTNWRSATSRTGRRRRWRRTCRRNGRRCCASPAS